MYLLWELQNFFKKQDNRLSSHIPLTTHNGGKRTTEKVTVTQKEMSSSESVKPVT